MWNSSGTIQHMVSSLFGLLVFFSIFIPDGVVGGTQTRKQTGIQSNVEWRLRRKWSPRHQSKAIFNPHWFLGWITQNKFTLEVPSEITSVSSVQENYSANEWCQQLGHPIVNLGIWGVWIPKQLKWVNICKGLQGVLNKDREPGAGTKTSGTLNLKTREE